jgi:gag-polyprotein putative aspartyl protease
MEFNPMKKLALALALTSLLSLLPLAAHAAPQPTDEPSLAPRPIRTTLRLGPSGQTGSIKVSFYDGSRKGHVLSCVVDTGADGVLVPVDQVSLPVVKKATFDRMITIQDATGKLTEMYRITTRDASIKARTMQNVDITIGPKGSTCLLGRSFLDRLGRYSIFVEDGTAYLEY